MEWNYLSPPLFRDPNDTSYLGGSHNTCWILLNLLSKILQGFFSFVSLPSPCTQIQIFILIAFHLAGRFYPLFHAVKITWYSSLDCVFCINYADETSSAGFINIVSDFFWDFVVQSLQRDDIASAWQLGVSVLLVYLVSSFSLLQDLTLMITFLENPWINI